MFQTPSYIKKCHVKYPVVEPRKVVNEISKYESEGKLAKLEVVSDTLRNKPHISRTFHSKTKYKCNICKKNFDTSLAAMEKHVQSHLNNRFIKYGAGKKKKKSTFFRPIDHFYNTETGKHIIPQNINMCSIIPPGNVNYSEEHRTIKCRILCSVFSPGFDAPVLCHISNNESKCKKVRRFENHHESKCKKV